MAKIGRKAIDADIFLSVFAFDGDELPLFAVHNERIFKGSKADKFCEFHWDLELRFEEDEEEGVTGDGVKEG